MSTTHDIDYETIITRTLEDFAPVKRLWPAPVRLLLWILVQMVVVAILLTLDDYHDRSTLLSARNAFIAICPLLATSCGAAWLALRSAIPGRAVRYFETALLALSLCASFALATKAASIAGFDLASAASAPGTLSLLLLLPTVPCLTLFLAVRRGFPLQPALSGLLVGIASSSFALGIYLFLAAVDGFQASLLQLAIFITLVPLISGLFGRFSLDSIAGLRRIRSAEAVSYQLPSSDTFFAIAISVAILALLILPKFNSISVPDFNLAIDAYESSLQHFRPNVPSGSIDAMLTAYVNHGMPAYMWDFSSQGYKLIGGRWAPLTDGTPVTYTWFRGPKNGIMCLFRSTESFHPPNAPHRQFHGLLFYRYQGFSICVVNVGGYGSFIGVVAAKMPMQKFVLLVTDAIG